MGTVDLRAVAATLRRHGVAEVDTSSRRRAEYSTDASLYRVVPTAVVFPQSVDEIAAALEACRELGLPLVMRGGGTSIAGNAVGTGVVVDASRHLRRIHSIDPERKIAVVDPGVVLDDLQRAAARHGLRFGPDPSTHSRCTIGGMIGNNSCGSRSLRYGRTADNVEQLDVLTGTGERLTAGRNTTASPTLVTLHTVVRSNLAVIRTEFGRFGRQASGYSLEHLLPENGFDVARGLVGTEGSCALTLSAALRLVPQPSTTVLVVLGYPDLPTAADAVPALRDLKPYAIEGLDTRIVDIVRRVRGPGAVPPVPPGAGLLFVEVADPAAAAAVVATAQADDSRVLTDAAEAAQLWRIREDGAGLASRPDAAVRSVHAGWEDAAVPPQRLGAYLREFAALLVQYGLSGLPYGHFGDGCLHIRLNFPLSSPGGPAAFRRFLLDAAALVAAHGGSMSGEHGDGRARSELLPIMYSGAALAAIASVKDVFDPDGLLNPGVVVRPAPVDADLRPASVRPLSRHLGFRYHDDGGDFAHAVHRCIGVGKCRADLTSRDPGSGGGPGSGGVMCPSYLATRDEKDSTRGRARVLQEMANDNTLVRGWRSPELREALDLCLSCKGCASDCPTGTDMATYKSEVLYQAYRGRLRPRAHYALGWLPTWVRLASRAPRLANRLLASPLAGLGKWLAGVDGRVDPPRLAARTFRRWFDTRPVSPGDPVVLWVDTFTDHFTPEVGEAAVRVLEEAGYSVRVPSAPVCCGLTWISTGQLDVARRKLRRACAVLAPYVRAGVPIVGLEPSCVAVFRGDADDLIGDASRIGDTSVGHAVRTLSELLSGRSGWRPPDLSGLRAVAKPHCHHHAILGWSADQSLLERAGVAVERVDGCCGLAGNFGVEKGLFDVGEAVAKTALLPAIEKAGPSDVVLADGFSCRTQIRQLSGRRALHLAELLTAHPDLLVDHEPGVATTR
jgi:FAD/FMN-containing dehydrogenase/Fe-S oxidoreductase